MIRYISRLSASSQKEARLRGARLGHIIRYTAQEERERGVSAPFELGHHLT
jgi:hypothetical protein